MNKAGFFNQVIDKERYIFCGVALPHSVSDEWQSYYLAYEK